MHLELKTPMKITITGTIQGTCPISKVHDTYTFSVEYSPLDGEVLEFYQFRRFLNKLEETEELFIEQVCDQIYTELKKYNPCVVVVDNSPGLRVRVEAPYGF